MGATKKKKKERKRFDAGFRPHEAQVLLGRVSGMTIEELMEELEASRSSIKRYLELLDRRGFPLEVIGRRDGKQIHRISPKALSHAVVFTLLEVFWQKVTERYLGCFAGTDVEEALRGISAKIDATLGAKERAYVEKLAGRIHDIPDHPHDYSGKAGVIGPLVQAILDDRPVFLTQGKTKSDLRRLRFDPYTLVTYKRALYVVGWSHEWGGIRTLSIGGIHEVERIETEKVDRRGFDPRAHFAGSFGIFLDDETEVVLRFDADLGPALRARKYHPTQSFEERDGFVFLTMRPRGTVEVLSWVMSWGPKAAVISPPDLRAKWKAQIQALAKVAAETEPG